MKIRVSMAAIAVVAFTALAQPASAQESRVKIGELRCDVSSGLGLIVTSSREMSCVYTGIHGFKERYYGAIRKFGLDIGQTNRGVLEWAVFAPTAGERRGALAGDYVGADASVTVGAGLGPTRWSAGSRARSRCNRCRSRCSRASRSPPAWPR